MSALEIRPQGWKHSVCARSKGAFVPLEVCATWEDANDVLELGNLDYVPDWLNPPAKQREGEADGERRQQFNKGAEQ